MDANLVIAGFGGQGVMAMGKLLTYAGMIENKEVAWLPSYGPEMRGGTANCNVVISDKPVASPLVTDATAALVMNKPSLDKFEETVIKGGQLFINSSLIEQKSTRDDIDVFYVPANEIANKLGNSRVANMVMLGAYLEKNHAVKDESILTAFTKVFGEGKAKLIPINEKALQAGAEAVK